MIYVSKRVAILGGAGPLAALRLHQLLLNRFIKQGAVQDMDFPPVMVWNIPIAGLSELGIENASKVNESLKEAFRVFQAAQIDLVIPACNTISPELEKMAHDAQIEIWSLPKLCLKYAESKGYERVGILCSKTARRDKMHALLAPNGMKVIYPPQNIQMIVNDMIQSSMGGAKITLTAWTQLQAWSGQENLDALILGCSELSSPENFQLPTIDSLQIAVDTYMKGKI